MNIAIVGTGYVGLVTGTCFAEMGVNVTCVDIDENKISALQNGKIPIYEPGLEEMVIRNQKEGRLNFTTQLASCINNVDIVFSAVGTPPDEDGSADLRYVINVARDFGRNVMKYAVLVTKSTVPVGTAQKIKVVIQEELDKRGVKIPFDVASNPEFLKEGAAIQDFMSPDRVVVGIESERSKELMSKLYRPFLLNNFRVIFTDIPSAEMIKYAANSMLATRISFMNDIANLCELVGANVNMVRKGIGADSRIGNKFLYPGCGYGGSCFPKDTKALQYLAQKGGYELKTVKAAIEVNREQQLILLKKARKSIKSFKGLNVAVLGLTFKPGTDDLRAAPSLTNVPILLEEGAKIKAYDPIGVENYKRFYPSEIEYTKTPQEALIDADVCFIFTEWQQIKDVKPEEYKKLMKNPLVYDGRNIYTIEDMKENGIEYYSVGRR
mgnify:CR=1 FL=1